MLANNSISDFALLKLTEDPINLANYKPYYLGWDRTGNSGTGGVGIHHPEGDVKKIATYKMTPYTTSGGTHWVINCVQTENGFGILQHCSSGSPLINNNHKVIGQLHSGNPNCSTPSSSLFKYGRFDISWTGNGDTDSRRRLKDWLDPTNSEVQTLDGRHSFDVPNMWLSGNDFVCNIETYVVHHVPSDAFVEWEFHKTEGNDIIGIVPIGEKRDSCRVSREYANLELFEGVLSAKVYISGILVKTFKKTIRGDGDFVGFYWDGAPYEDARENYMMEDDNWISPGSMVLIRSDNLKRKMIHIGKPTDLISLYNGTTCQTNEYFFECIGYQPGDTIAISVYGDGCCQIDKFLFYVKSPNQQNASHLEVSTIGENLYQLNLVSEKPENVKNKSNIESERNAHRWEYWVYNAANSRMTTIGEQKGNSLIIDTSNWSLGVYAVYAKIDGKPYSAKIIRK